MEGTEHYQGYMEFSGQKSLLQLKAMPGLETAHFERRKGSQKQAIDYCRKSETMVDGPYVFGEANEQGKRNDLEEVKKRIREGASMIDIADEHFTEFCKYSKAFKEYKSMCMEKRTWAMDLVFLIGPTRTGKTRTAMEMAGESVYVKPPGKWWDNYDGEETVIIDEMYGSSFPFTELLQLLDRYPYSIETKGGTVEFISKRIVMTSNQEPEDWYDSEKTHQMDWATNPLNRRLTEFCRIIRTGEVHRRIRPVLAQFGIPQ